MEIRYSAKMIPHFCELVASLPVKTGLKRPEPGILAENWLDFRKFCGALTVTPGGLFVALFSVVP